jgi:hypothetical protein
MDYKYLDTKSETSSCTLEEYKFVYARLMKAFTNKLDECNGMIFNELIFIEREIKNHLMNMVSKEDTMLSISDFEYRRTHFDEEGVSGELKFLQMMSSLELLVTRHKAIIEHLKTRKNELISSQQNEINNNDEVKHKKEFSEFIHNVSNKDNFIKDLTDTFKSEIGINFRILIENLKENQIVIIPNRENKLFIEAAAIEFKRHIGSPQSINDNFQNTITHKEIYSENIKTITEKVNPLIIKYKKK